MQSVFRIGLGMLFVVAISCGCGEVTGELNWNKSSQKPSTSNVQDVGDADFNPAKAGVVIVLPMEKQSPQEPTLEIQGTYDDLPSGWQLFAFLEDSYRFYLQYPPLRISPQRKTFSQRNIRPDNEEHTLHVCLVNPEASRFLEELAAKNEWGGFANLPDGVFICDSVSLK